LGGERERWSEMVEKLSVNMTNLFGDVFLSAGIISFLGAFSGQYRDEIMTQWMPFLMKSSVPCSDDFLLKEVLGEPITIQNWVISGLPDDKTSLENAIMIDKIDNWPLIIDP
jgi:dynein heavy chain